MQISVDSSPFFHDLSPLFAHLLVIALDCNLFILFSQNEKKMFGFPSSQGLQNERDQEPTLLGEYEYADNGVALQYFPVKNKLEQLFDIVELRIESNHGNIHYTCLYRFRVHGTPNL